MRSADVQAGRCRQKLKRASSGALIPICSRGKSCSSPTSRRLKGAWLSRRSQLSKRSSSSALALKSWASSNTISGPSRDNCCQAERISRRLSLRRIRGLTPSSAQSNRIRSVAVTEACEMRMDLKRFSGKVRINCSIRRVLPTPLGPWTRPQARTATNCSSRWLWSLKIAERTGVETLSARGISLAPERVLRAVCASKGLVRALIITVGIGFGVELFVTAAGQRHQVILVPDLDAFPIEGIKTQLHDLAAQMGGHFPDLAIQTNGGVQPHAASGAAQEQPFPVGLRIQNLQGLGALGKALGWALVIQSAVRTLVIFAFDPTPPPLVEFLQRVNRIQKQTGLKVILQGAEESFDLAAAPSRIGFGVKQADVQVGADDLQMGAQEDFSSIGVELVRDTAAGEGLAQAIQKPTELLALVILGMRHQTRAVVDQRKQAAVEDRAGRELDRGAKHHVGHPELIAQGAFEGFARAAGDGVGGGAFESAIIQALGGQKTIDRRQTEGARAQNTLVQQLADQHRDFELGILPA